MNIRAVTSAITAFSFVTLANAFMPPPYGLEEEINWIAALCGLSGYIAGAAVARFRLHRRIRIDRKLKVGLAVGASIGAIVFGLKYLTMWNAGGISTHYYGWALSSLGLATVCLSYFLGFAGFSVGRKDEE